MKTRARSKNRAPLVSLMVASAISMTGNRMVLVAIPWFVLETTGSAIRTGITGFFTFLPIVAAGFLGPVVDRIGLKRSSVVADIASGVSVGLIPLLFHTIGLEFWQLVTLVFLGGLFDSPGETARSTLLPEAAEAAGTTLERATSLEDGIQRAASLAGAPLAAVLISILDATTVLWIDAASFGVSALLIAYWGPSVAAPKDRQKATYWRDFREPMSFIRGRKALVVVTITLAVTNLLDAAIAVIVLPVYAKEIFDSVIALGLMLGAYGGGAVLGSLIYGWRGERYSRHWVYVAGFALVALQPWGYSLMPGLGPMILISLVAGLGSGPINPIITAVLLEQVPLAMRGRVFAAIKALAWIMVPLGILAGGVVIEGLGLLTTLVIIGFVYLIALVALGLNLADADLERPVREAQTKSPSEARVET